MTAFARTIALGAMLLLSPLSALHQTLSNDYFKPLLNVYCSGDYYAEGELLYWTHSDCDFGYAVEIDDILVSAPATPPAISFNADRGKKEFVRPGYNPGFRVHIGFRSPECFHQDLSYTWLEIRSGNATKLDINSPIQQVEPGFIFSNAFDGNPNKITGKVISRYQRINLEVGSLFDTGDWGDFTGGGQYMWVGITHYHNTSAVVPALGDAARIPVMRQKFTFSGGGVGYFVGYSLKLSKCNLRGIGRAAIIGLMGRQRVTRRGIATLPDFTVNPSGAFAFNEMHTVPGRTCFFPAFEAMVGLCYLHEGRCLTTRLRLTYEINQFISVLSYRIGGSGTAPPIPENPLVGNLSYGGPTLSLEVGY